MALAKKGIDIRETAGHLLFRAFLQTSAGAILTTGTTSLYLYEVQSDGTLKSYDFNDNTFKATALTTETQALTHRQGNNGTTDTGIWTFALTTLTGFTVGGIYLARVKNTGASPTDQVREFQFGGAESDFLAPTAAGRFSSDVTAMSTDVMTAAALATDAVNEIADAILKRSASNVEATAGEHTLCTVILATLENSISGSTLTIKRTDGTTTHVTKTLTTDPAANPITGIT